jgi:hypothetical protein
MALERKTIIDQIEIRRDGTVHVRMAKVIVEGERIVASEYHRTALEPGADVDTTLAAVNAHLVQLGEAEIEAGEWARVRRVASLEHTKEIVDAHRARLTAARS